jgi:ankyrin repeat protein
VKFHARKIEKLLYTKDLLLNAEWNRPKEREVNLHRHPAFFGNADDVFHDCCGYCPKPITEEEEDIAKEESKIYISGDISFIKDDPGRQAIGSFNPTTETDWTEMAYVGNTTRLCQAIVDQDLEHVEDWLSQEDADVNRRDYTGRTPLHLACLTSTPDIVKCLVDHGARLVWRLADGRTALHIAAARGNVDIVKILLTKSEENEEAELVKAEARKHARAKERKLKREGTDVTMGGTQEEDDISMAEDGNTDNDDDDDDADDDEMLDDYSDDSNEEMHSTTTGSFVKIGKGENDDGDADNMPEEDEDEPDIYDINALAWDNHCSPLHMAILNGHVSVVEELVGSFGADVLLPIKLLNEYNKSPRAAILTLCLALQLPIEKARVMAAKLFDLGASVAQADLKGLTSLHYYASDCRPEALDIVLEADKPALQRSINYLAVTGSSWHSKVVSCLMSAIHARNPIGAIKLLAAGANPKISFEEYVKAASAQHVQIGRNSSEHNQEQFGREIEQPIITAAYQELPEIVIEFLQRGVDVNTLTTAANTILNAKNMRNYNTGESLLDVVRQK